MATLVVDIETVGEDFDAMDDATQDALTHWIASDDTEALEKVKNGLGLSPLTGDIAVIGVLDHEKDKGVVYYQAPDGDDEEQQDGNYTFRPMDEQEMLRAFWDGAARYDEFVTFNGRTFDIPFLMIRSAIHGITPSQDLMQGRYLYQQRGAQHIDLFDQLTFYGAFARRGRSLHMWARAFGIESPKTDGMSGADVGRLFAEGRYLDIARYNIGDLEATRALYEYWHTHLHFT